MLKPGVGYWVKCTSGTACITGVEIVSDSIAVLPGWNLVGSLSAPIGVTSITSDPAGIITSSFYTFGPSGYLPVASLLPGGGYWVRVHQAGTIVLDWAVAPSGR